MYPQINACFGGLVYSIQAPDQQVTALITLTFKCTTLLWME